MTVKENSARFTSTIPLRDPSPLREAASEDKRRRLLRMTEVSGFLKTSEILRQAQDDKITVFQRDEMTKPVRLWRESLRNHVMNDPSLHSG
jgi:hypothetical protein